MAFTHAAAPFEMRDGALLSADNAKPDRFTLISILSLAGSRLGLNPSVIATVDALLSCLPPKRHHDVVFASNATLVLRRNGISDRTLRRHIAELVKVGLLVRADSPNGKRYSKHDTTMGTALRFGLNLAPLFAAYDTLRDLAAHQKQELEQLAYMRTKLRNLIKKLDRDCDLVKEASRELRRKVSIDKLKDLIRQVERMVETKEHEVVETALTREELSASNGQNVRHQQTSKKENIDKTSTQEITVVPCNRKLSLEWLTIACPEATSFLPEPLTSPLDVVAHARRLAPMIGVDEFCYEAAEQRQGKLGAALSLWGLLEKQANIAQFGAYFRSVTSGKRSTTFNPWELINRLARRARAISPHCPRTMLNYSPQNLT